MNHSGGLSGLVVPEWVEEAGDRNAGRAVLEYSAHDSVLASEKYVLHRSR